MILCCLQSVKGSSRRISKINETRTTDDNAKADLVCIEMLTVTRPPIRKGSREERHLRGMASRRKTHEFENNGTAWPVAQASVISALGANSDSVLVRIMQSDLRSKCPGDYIGARHGFDGGGDCRRDCDPDEQSDF